MSVVAGQFFAQYLSVVFVTFITLAVMIGFIVRLLRK